MAENQATVIDKLINEPIAFIYVFIGLTLAVLSIPFARRTRRFWLKLLSTQKGISSTAFLFVWILASLASSYMSPDEFAPDLAGLNKEPNYPLVHVIIQSFILAICLDLSARLITLPIRNRVRRRLYACLLKLGLGVVFLGATLFAEMVSKVEFAAMIIFTPPLFHIFKMPMYVPIPLYIATFPFSLPGAIIADKAIGLKKPLNKIPVTVIVLIILPAILINVSFNIFELSNPLIERIMPTPEAAIYASETNCQIDDHRVVAVSSYLTIREAKSIVVNSDQMAIFYHDESYDLRYLGRGSDDQTFVLSDSKFLPVRFIVRPDSKTATKAALSTGPFSCSLKVMGILNAKGSRVETSTDE